MTMDPGLPGDAESVRQAEADEPIVPLASGAPYSSGTESDVDKKALHRFGYAQQLLRDMGGFSNFAISFSIISILTGAVTLYGTGLQAGGPVIMGIGWPLVTLFVLFIAASMAELASAIPTSGALYHWAALLGGAGWGWLTGWLNLVGLIATITGIDYGCAGFLTRCWVCPIPGGASCWSLPDCCSPMASLTMWVSGR